MIATTADATPQVHGRLRPMDPARDLGAVANLIADAFADEMDQRGRAALREMRWMARLSPLVWWWSMADPAFSDAFNGFVWEEPSPKRRGLQVVGNVSLSRAPGNRQRWIICNVVVQAEYRGRSIGQQLVDAAIVEARAMQAVGVLLQVYEDNLRALRLYTHRGFQEAAGETDLRLEAAQSVPIIDAPGYRIRAWQPADGQAVQELARLVIPPELQWLKPIQSNAYQPSWGSRLGRNLADLLAGRRLYRLSAIKDERLVASMAVTAAFWGSEHHLEILIHPDHAGQMEAALISRALQILSAIPPRPIRITADKDDTDLLAALHAYGFERRRTLLTLWKNF
jgi:ribosomal protein S18 acetylase RimI-like enzyme